MTTYVFVFLGEFGYELMNWQGVVRKFSRSLDPGDRIVCCGRANVSQLYESAAAYIDISACKRYSESMADCYRGVLRPVPIPRGGQRLACRLMLREIRKGIQQGPAGPFRLEHGSWGATTEAPGSQFTWIFSSSLTELNGRKFGADWRRFDVDGDQGIYSNLDLANNEYARIEPDIARRAELEERLGFSLDDGFVLIQGRQRQTAQKSHERLELDPFIEAVADQARVVALDFETTRAHDSYSRFSGSGGKVTNLRLSSLAEQSCMIHFASACLFFTEGDLGSHIYIPPMMGKDVWAVAPPSVLGLPSSPIRFWNEHVFTFGGQIRPVAAALGPDYPRMLSSPGDVQSLARNIVAESNSKTL